jgi:hypothetical protein
VPPFVGTAVKVIEPPEQVVVAEGLTVTEGVKIGLTVIVTGVEVAVAGEGQIAEEVMDTVTWSPLLSVAEE